MKTQNTTNSQNLEKEKTEGIMSLDLISNYTRKLSESIQYDTDQKKKKTRNINQWNRLEPRNENLDAHLISNKVCKNI